MATISTVSVDFVAKTQKFSEGMKSMRKSTKSWHKDMSSTMSSVKQLIAGIAIGAAMKKIAAEVDQAVKALARVNDEAQKLNMSVTAYQTFAKVFSDAGSNVEALKTSMGTLQRAMDGAARGGARQLEAFDMLGVSVARLQKLSPDEQFVAIAESLNAMTDSNAKASAGLTLFGTQYSELLPIINGGSAAIAKAAREGASTGEVLSKGAIDGAKKFQLSIKAIGDQFGGYMSIFAAAISPVGKEIADGLTPSIERAGSAFDTIGSAIDAMAVPVTVLLLGIQVLQAAFYGIQTAIYTVASGAVKGFSLLISGFNKVQEGIFVGVNAIRLAWSQLPFTDSVFEPIVFDKMFQGVQATLENISTSAAEIAIESSGKIAAAFGSESISNKFKTRVAQIKEELVNLKAAAVAEADDYSKKIQSVAGTGENSQFSRDILTREQLLADLARAQIKYHDDLAKSVAKYKDVSVGYAQEIYNINSAVAEGLLTNDEASRALTQTYGEMFVNSNTWFTAAANSMSSLADGMSRAIVAGEGLGDVFKSLLKDIAVMIVKSMILSALYALLGFADFGAFKGIQAAFGTLTGSGPAARAKGGPVSSGTPYMVGERGKELFVPSASGYIVPNDKMNGGSNVSVNQTFNVSAGVSQTVRAEMIQFLPIFKQQATVGVLDAVRRGGEYSRVIRG